jgi:eukaryotic-like serine/threonine-protein kinase
MVAEDLLALSELLDEALDLDAGARDSWLADLQRTQPQIAVRLEALLKRTEELKTDHLLIGGGRSVAPEVLADVMENTGGEARIQGFLLQAGAQVGPYRLIKPLGEGGMASVWLAERSDGQLKREVALKLLHAWRNSKELVERFARERDMLAGLVHPHIARLYDAGVTETGQPWIALEYVEGIDLTTYADKNRLPIRARVESMLQVMSAVQHAHQNLIVHRDIKPNNILVNAKGEVRLLDFGIAKLLQANENSAAESELTKNAGRALTIRYAAPEQISGDPVTTATDVYALGLVMYELLTGASPRHGGKTQILAEQAAMSTDVLRPSRAPVNDDMSHRRGNITARELKSELTGDLDTIILKALAREPARRYRTVDAFAADLHAWMEQRPIAARAPSFAYQLKMLLVRQRVPVAMGCAVLIALGGAGVFAWKQRVQADTQRQRAEQVQMYMANLLSDAEPEGVEGEKALTAKSLLDAGVERAQRDYRTEPVMQSALLTEMARVYLRIGETDVGETLLRGAIDLSKGRVAAGDAAPQVAAAYLGESLMERGEQESGGALLNAVLSGCATEDPACRLARGIAHLGLARRTNIDAAQRREDLRAARALLENNRAASSHHQFQALALSADLARNDGSFTTSAALVAQIERDRDGRPLKLNERVLFDTVKSNLAFDQGNYALAAEIVDRLLLDISRYNVDSTKLYLHVSRAHIANYQGLADTALKHTAQAREIASTQEPSYLLAYGLRYETRALAMQGDFPRAMRSYEQAFQTLRKMGIAETAVSWLDMVRAAGEVEARQGNLRGAKDKLAEILALLKKLHPGQFKDMVNTLDLLGAIAQAMGDAKLAQDFHREEIEILKSHLPEDHPMRIRAEFQLARARFALDGHSADRIEVARLSGKLMSFVPVESVHARTLSAFLSALESGKVGQPLLVVF